METIAILKPIKNTAAKATFFAVIIFLFIIMFGKSVMAQTIPGVSQDSIKHRDSVTISGSGLGIESQALPVVWDNIEDGVCDLTATVRAWSLINDLSLNTDNDGTDNCNIGEIGDDSKIINYNDSDLSCNTTTPRSITDANWSSAPQVTGEPFPQIAETSETHTVAGLTPETNCSFAIKTSDEVPNESGLGNVASETTIAGFAVTASDSGSTPLYGTFELILDAPEVSENKFTKFASVVFSKGTRNFNVDGFHDGGDIWRARFMPDQEGIWNYSWSFHNSSGNGSFVCTVRTNAKAHGHVKVDSAHSRYLVYDDGTAHHWFGGKWIAAPNYGPSSKGAETNDGRYSDAEFLNYLNTCENYKHNGLLIKTSLYPIENDKFSWDLNWIHRGEWMIKEMAERGIYCQVNFFDTWSRDKDKWFSYNTNGPSQVFNVWASGDEDAKENYIRTIVARFSGFYNVYWELGNEMEHSPNSGSAFVTEANAKYIPWTRQYDPYGLPIGLSENVWKNADVDVGFLHQPRTSSLPSTSWKKPTIMNELVSGDVDGSMWRDDVIRDFTTRYSYRSTFWRMFTYGGVGSSEATWLNIKTSFNDAVLDVMGDQQRCCEFIDALPVHINEMNTDTGFLNSGPGSYRTRHKDGQCYVTYFLLGKNQNTGSGTVNVDLPVGIYTVKWYSPKDGNYTNQSAITSSGGAEIILHPAFTEDIVLLVETSAPVTTPLSRSNPDNFTLQQNYPNPFNPSTTIEYSVAKLCNVQIIIYNRLGQEIRMLVNEQKPAGKHNIKWDGKDAKGNKLASGIYFYRLMAGKQVDTKKMLYLR